jgi:hypothetical protein
MITLFLSLSACSLTPHSTLTVSDEVKVWRSQYRAEKPDDPFLPSVEKQTLQKGMSRVHVLLAWGRPKHRELQADRSAENWVYDLTEEPEIQPRKLAHLFFERQRDELVLVRWRLDRGYLYFVDPEKGDRFPTDIKGIPDLDAPKGRIP